MGIAVVFYEILIHVFQLLLYSLAGAGLAGQGAFDLIGKFKSAEANLHCFIPLFELVIFSQSMDGLSNNEMGLLFFTFVISSAFACIFGLLYGKFSKMDVRARRVFALICTWGDVAFLPEVLTAALCNPAGPFAGDPHCSMNFNYSFYVLFLFNISLLLAGPFFMHSDQAVAQHIMRKMMLIKHFYPASPQDFMDDTNLARLEETPPAIKNKAEEPMSIAIVPSTEKSPDIANRHNELMETEAHLAMPANMKVVFETISKDKKVADSIFLDEELYKYSNMITLDEDTAEKFENHFNLFLSKIKPEVFVKLYQNVPNIQIAPKLDLPLVIHWLTSRPIWGCIIAVIFGRITPVMDWFFRDNQVTRAFMGTVKALSNLAIPLAVMIWGMILIDGLHVRGRILRIIDIVAMGTIRLVLVPAIGLGFAHGLIGDGISALTDNKVLAFHLYANWAVPPGLLLLTLFVLSKYFDREGALLMFWCKIACIILSTLFTWAYLGMYNLNFPDVPYKAV